MRMTAKGFALALTLAVMAQGLAGCGLFFGKHYDGSETFYDQHPEYNAEPAYLHGQGDPIAPGDGRPF